jgi:outer membrane lipoprotein-sorting protein/peroxiredoxin
VFVASAHTRSALEEAPDKFPATTGSSQASTFIDGANDMRTRLIASLAACTILVGAAHAQVQEDAKKVLSEAAEAMKSYEGISFKSKRYGTGMLKEIIDADGTVKIWQRKGAEPVIKVDGRVKQPGKADKKQMTVSDGKVVRWLDWTDNTLKERSISDLGAVSEMNIAKQIIPEEFLAMKDTFNRELTMGKLTKIGTENVNGEPCEIIEAMPKDESRNFTWAISVKDRLPRRFVMGTGKAEVKLEMITEITDVKTDNKFTAKDFEIPLPEVGGFVVDSKINQPVQQPQVINDPNLVNPGAPVPPVDLGLKAGTPAPAFSAKDVAGTDQSMTGYKGKVVVMEFWGPMFKRSLLPSKDMDALAGEMGKDGKVAFVGLACRDNGQGKAAQWWKDQGKAYPLIASGDTIAADYKVSGYPSYYIIGTDGTVSAFYQDFPGREAMKNAITAAMK